MRAIDADAMIERLKKWDTEDKTDKALYNFTLSRINEQPTIQPEPHWIPVTERLPEEEDSIFARYYGTDRWRKSMFRKKSREVIVTSVFEDGELHTEVAHTTDGEWHVGVNVVPRTVIAWMPLPEPYTERKGELMSDLISKQAAIDAVKRLSLGETDATRLAMRIGDYLERLPPAQPKPSEAARDIATIIENEKDMRVITDNNLWYQRGYEDGFREGRTRAELLERLDDDLK